MKNSNDVVRCSDVESLNRFICEYVDEQKLEGVEKVKIYWALFLFYLENGVTLCL